MTSGGTESILMACKAYRDYARETKGIRKPEIVVPATAHSAFDKAGQFLRLRVRSVPVDPVTTKVNMRAMKRAINCNTIMVIDNCSWGGDDLVLSIVSW
jgi:sphinganine-1-phosphate aldolase